MDGVDGDPGDREALREYRWLMGTSAHFFFFFCSLLKVHVDRPSLSLAGPVSGTGVGIFT